MVKQKIFFVSDGELYDEQIIGAILATENDRGRIDAIIRNEVRVYNSSFTAWKELKENTIKIFMKIEEYEKFYKDNPEPNLFEMVKGALNKEGYVLVDVNEDFSFYTGE